MSNEKSIAEQTHKIFQRSVSFANQQNPECDKDTKYHLALSYAAECVISGDDFVRTNAADILFRIRIGILQMLRSEKETV